ncbi:MAG: UDP-glucose/GDP-mannose dehydrogenase family protein, partial [candidate division Zixibacteria bacterium]|nr:UDP-glucose/GDP-mannose dehydrogenase family protein [candidate division Zixibacteria bacterium]
AEMIKYASNAMLALKISFINEIANLCDHVGADVYDVARAVGMDKRIGSKFLHPGPGFGGSCFPKDVNAIVSLAKKVGYDFRLGNTINEVNLRQKETVVEKSRELLGSFDGKTVTLLGLSFKPETDDVRESPALHIAQRVKEEGGMVRAYDPAAMDEAKKALPDVKYCSSYPEACDGADLIIITTE